MHTNKNILFFSLTGILVVLLFILDLFWGSVTIPPREIFSILFGESSNDAWIYIVKEYRLPKALTALFTGISLSIAGLMMQTLFRNPLAGPYVLGISSGASLGVALFIMAGFLVPGFALVSVLGSWGFVISAVIGALLVMSIVMLVSFNVSDSVSLLIIGIMFGSITAAVVSILQYFSDPQQVHNYLMWTFGSLSSCTWDEIEIMLLLIIPAIIISFFSTKSLNALLLGENYARGLGVNIKTVRILIILAASFLAGTLTAFTGPIGFIGIAVPHLTRFVIKTSDHKILLPAVSLMGAALLLVCDIISQIPGYQQTLPINSVTALFGAPVVIWVIFRSRKIKVKF